jgi:hypothetical protein
MSDPAPVHRIHPTDETLQYWTEHLLPDLDVWFWDDGALDLDLTDCVVMPRADYLQHPTFQDIRFVNAYLHWQMPREVTRLIVSGPAWISRLTGADLRRVLGKQVDLRRGLVFPRTHFDTLPDDLQAFTVNDHVVLCHEAWRAVPDQVRRVVLLKEQRLWDDVDCLQVPDDAPAHIRAIANTFVQHEGANCLSTTAYCVTGQGWMRSLWMYQPMFRYLIAQHGYRPVPDVSPGADDLVTFEADGVIVHAVYCVGHDRFLNKNGQSRFNPIRIIDWARLHADWHKATCGIFRRQTALRDA